MAIQKLYAGVKLRELRGRLGLTQKAFAGKLGVSLPYLNQMENNNRPVSTAVVLGLAQEFGFDVTELQSGDEARLVGDMREALADHPVDANAQAAAGRRRRLLIADMDSTIITSESLDELAEYAGLKEVISAITARAMRGELDFEAALTERVAMLAGLPDSAVDAVVAGLRITPGAA